MKKAKRTRSTSQAKKTHKSPSPAEAPTKTSRRDLLVRARNWTIGLAIVGGGGAILTRNVYGTIREHDLSRVTNGTPTIVQVHDPQCSMCRALQSETRRALKHFEGGDINYVIANIATPEGRNFAAQYGAQHVTLLLFDADGRLRESLQGEREEGELRVAFERLRSGQSDG